MAINWFPGHMTKSMRMIEENLKLIDVIIYVLDSRAPLSCLNPSLDALTRGMPVIYVLNKSDLGDRSRVAEWQRYLTGEKSSAVAIDSTASKSAKIISQLAEDMCKNKLIKYRDKGVKASIKAMVLGVPNSGKSTLINNLVGSGKTVTGNKPGVTRGKQWVRVSEFFEVLDTPGTLYPKLTNQLIAMHLVYIGSIKDEVADMTEVSLSFIEEINSLDVNILKNRYNVETDAPLQTLENIANRRGFKIKGGEVDIDKAAVAILDDFRKGRLGRITLDKITV